MAPRCTCECHYTNMPSKDATARIRIIIADDHLLLRQGLQVLIETEPDMVVVAQADSGKSVVPLTLAEQPDVVVMDVSMPDGDGIEATAHILGDCPTVRVVGLSRHSDPGYARRLFEAGAVGYVVKKTSVEELVNAIRVVVAGGVYVDSVMKPLLSDRPFGMANARQQGALTDREADVLRQIARGRSNKEIALDLKISVKTVEYHKARCSAKLHLGSRADIVKYAISQRWLEE
jgi:two-component system, NarL family, response regulator NreC